MKKMVVIALLAFAVATGAVWADEHPSEHPSEHPKAKPKPASAAGAGVLDGKVFVGELVKSGETSGDKDQLTFEKGTFTSSACTAYGFHQTAYTATEKDGVITFTSNAKNADGEVMEWSGTIKQGVLEGTAVHKSKSGETKYAFKGKMK